MTGLSTPLKFCYDHVIRHLLSTKLQEKVMLVDVNKVSGSPYVSFKTHLTSRLLSRCCALGAAFNPFSRYFFPKVRVFSRSTTPRHSHGTLLRRHRVELLA